MDRRLRALVFAALLSGAPVLLACGDNAAEQDSEQSERVAEATDAEATPIESPTQSSIPAAPKGTANAQDARIANDVLLRFVNDRTVDAQHFAVFVEDGVLTLLPNDHADDEEIEAAKVLVQSVDGLKDVTVNGQKAPAQKPDEETQDIVEAIDKAHEDAPVDAEEVDLEAAALFAEPSAVEDAPAEADAAAAQEDAGDQDENAAAAKDAPASDEYREYTLRRGDSLSIVAARELGNGARWKEIYQLNRDVIGSNPDGIRDGMVIKLPPPR